MKKIIVIGILAVAAFGCKSKTTDGKSNKEKVVELLQSLESGDHAPVGYINPKKYIQHNLLVGDGLEGFGEFMKHKPATGFKAKVIRAFQEGDYVVSHTEYDLFGPKIGFDIFRFENGLIVEHWDNLQETVAVGKSGHSMTDGPAKVEDLGKTNENKKLVEGFYSDVLKGGDLSKIDLYLNPKQYIQHNPQATDGVEAFTGFMKFAKEKNFFKINKIHKVFAEGNFVLVQSAGQMLGKDAAFYDLFRIENGKIVEHWDVIETIIPKDKWKNTNGKF